MAALMAVLFMVERQTRNTGVPTAENGAENAGRPLPGEFELTPFGGGEPVKLSRFKGKTVLINFWASWCEACMEEMPSIVKLQQTLGPSGFAVVSVNVDEDPDKKVPKIIERFKIPFPVYVDKSEKLAAAFNVVAIPYNIVAGPDQKVAWTESGERDWASEDVLKEFRQLIKK